LAAALKQGWWVNTPDYEGLEAHYTAGLQLGYATLDSVRVILNTAPALGLDLDAKYAMWGYLGGAVASGWAAELQPTYAPELEFQGAAVGGPCPNIANVLQTINKGPFVGLAFAGLHGIARAYPNLTQYIVENILPEKWDEYNEIANSCLVGAITRGIFQDVFSYFRKGANSMNDAVPASILKWGGTMGLHGTTSHATSL
jgi:hypothetical protein